MNLDGRRLLLIGDAFLSFCLILVGFVLFVAGLGFSKSPTSFESQLGAVAVYTFGAIIFLVGCELADRTYLGFRSLRGAKENSGNGPT